jgi:serine/threonine protein kinase
MERHVALKVLKPEMEDRQRIKERFLREVRIISKLRHPHTVTIHDFGETGNIVYMVLEFIRGETLKEIVQENGPQSPERAVDLMSQALGSLGEAHKHDVVHRDIKPANIMVTNIEEDKDFIKVLDFGVAGLLKSESQDLTNAGVEDGERQLIGTPRYMSPEQVRGHDLTGASDIYSVGLVFYEILTGSKAVHGDTTMALITKQIKEQPLELPELEKLDDQLGQIIRKMTSKPVDERYQKAGEVREELKDYLSTKRAGSSSERQLERNPAEATEALDFSDEQRSEAEDQDALDDFLENVKSDDEDEDKSPQRDRAQRQQQAAVGVEAEASPGRSEEQKPTPPADKQHKSSEEDLKIEDDNDPAVYHTNSAEVTEMEDQHVSTTSTLRKNKSSPNSKRAFGRFIQGVADLLFLVIVGAAAVFGTYVLVLIAGPSARAQLGSNLGFIGFIAAPFIGFVFGVLLKDRLRRFVHGGEGFLPEWIRIGVGMFFVNLVLSIGLFVASPKTVIEELKFEPDNFVPKTMESGWVYKSHKKFTGVLGERLKHSSRAIGLHVGLIKRPGEEKADSEKKKENEDAVPVERNAEPATGAPGDSEQSRDKSSDKEKFGDEYERWE